MLFWCLAPALAALPTEAELFAGVLGRIDLDGNGTLSHAEYLRVDGETNFEAMDADRDDQVTVEELAAWVKVTQPRPMDRPASPANLGPPAGLPPPSGAFAPVATRAADWPVSPAPPSEDRTLFRALVLGAMTSVAGIAAWFIWRTPPRRRR